LEDLEKNADLPYVTDKLYHMVCLFILVIGSKQTLTVSQACGQKYETARLERYRLDQRQPSLKMLGYCILI
jgi:hypothetical protein